MRYQSKPGRCGAAVIVNTLRCHGQKISERKVAKMAGTNGDGTDEHGIMECLAQLKYDFIENEVQNRELAWGWLNSCLSAEMPVIITVENENHWVVVVGKVAGKPIVVDSSNTIRNRKENGVHVYSKVEFMKKWKALHDGSYYGLAVVKSKK